MTQRRLPFRITSDPTLFHRVKDQILSGLPGVQCYSDNMLITGSGEKSHLRNLDATLQRLEEYGLKVHKEKCEFSKPSVKYLGHVIDKDGLHKAPSKVKAIVEAPSTVHKSAEIISGVTDLCWVCALPRYLWPKQRHPLTCSQS